MEQNIKEIITIVLPIISILILFYALTMLEGHIKGLENTVSENIEKINELGREMGVRRNITAESIAFERIRNNYKLYRNDLSDQEITDFAVLKGLVDKDRMKKYE